MVSVLIAVRTDSGAAEHLLGVTRALLDRGHRVSVVTGERSVDLFRSLEVELHTVSEPVLPDAPVTEPSLLRRARYTLERAQRSTIEPLPEHAATVLRIVAAADIEVVVCEAAFFGASMLSSVPRSSRPAVIMLGVLPPWLPDPKLPPWGLGAPPTDSGIDRLRAAVFRAITARTYARLSRSLNSCVQRAYGVHRIGPIGTVAAAADIWAQLGVPRFEYPRTSLTSNFRYLGPPSPAPPDQVPEWWDPTREPPVVLVHTRRATRVSDLALPAIQAFGGTDSTLVIVGPRRRTAAAGNAGSLPANVHFEDRPPWPRLIAQRTVVISDGDYLNVQQALRYGVPLVVAATAGPQAETAARISWAGVGVRLKSLRPDPSELRAAVERVRRDPGYRVSASRIGLQIATTRAESDLCDMVESLAAS